MNFECAFDKNIILATHSQVVLGTQKHYQKQSIQYPDHLTKIRVVKLKPPKSDISISNIIPLSLHSWSARCGSTFFEVQGFTALKTCKTQLGEIATFQSISLTWKTWKSIRTLRHHLFMRRTNHIIFYNEVETCNYTPYH